MELWTNQPENREKNNNIIKIYIEKNKKDGRI
jgi:hypothetical protein